jgi:hypothetical protein
MRLMPRSLKESIKDVVYQDLLSMGPPARYRDQVVVLEYPVHPEPRFGFDRPPHRYLYDLVNRERQAFAELLIRFRGYRQLLQRIPVLPGEDSRTPHWANMWFTELDAIALYGLLAERKPGILLEVGSGVSTKFARRAIEDHNLRTRIISFDPTPRSTVNDLCDEVHRIPFEKADVGIVDMLQPGDVLFIDSSHRSFENSDVTVFFLEVLPRLQPGVLVHFHDILLPFDYPPEWAQRYYSEQYLLASFLLGKAERKGWRIVCPNAFISQDEQLGSLASDILGSDMKAAFDQVPVQRWWSPRQWSKPFRGVSMWLEA